MDKHNCTFQMQQYQKDLYPFGQLMSSLTAHKVQNFTGLFYSSLSHHQVAQFTIIIFTHFKSFSSIAHVFSITHFHRITEWLRLVGTSGGHLVHHPCSSMDTYGQLPRTMPASFGVSPRGKTSQPLRETSPMFNSISSLPLIHADYLILFQCCCC